MRKILFGAALLLSAILLFSQTSTSPRPGGGGGGGPTNGITSAEATNISRAFATGSTNYTKGASNGIMLVVNAKAPTNAPTLHGAQLNGITSIGTTAIKILDDGAGNAGIGWSPSAFFFRVFDEDSTVSIGNGGGTTNRGDLEATGDITAVNFYGSGANITDLTNALHKAETNAPSLYVPLLYGDIGYKATLGNILSYTFRADENSLLDTHIVSLERNEWVDGATSQGIIGYHRYGSGDIGISLRPQGAGSVTNTGKFYNSGALFIGNTNVMDAIGNIVAGTQNTNTLPVFHAGVLLSGTNVTDSQFANTVFVTNAITPDVGGTGRTNITAGRGLVFNGTNAPDDLIFGTGLSLSGSPGDGTRTLTSSGGTGASYDIDVEMTVFGNTATPIWTNVLGTNTTLLVWDAIGVVAGPTNTAYTKITAAGFHRYASTAVFDSSNTVGSATAIVLKTNGVNSVIANVTGAAGEMNTVRFRGFYLLVTNGPATISSAGVCPASGTAPDVVITGSGASTVGYTDSYYYLGNIYTNGVSAISVCKVKTSVESVVGNVSGKTVRVAIWSLSGNNLDTELGFAAVGTGVSAGVYTNELSAPVSFSPNTTYAITWTVSSTDTSNYINLTEGTPGTTDHVSEATWGADKTLARGPFDLRVATGLWLTQ